MLAWGSRLSSVCKRYFGPAYIDTDNGGLMAYLSNFPSTYRFGADYVDKILRGARPSDLPVADSRQFDVLVNARTARELGITVLTGRGAAGHSMGRVTGLSRRTILRAFHRQCERVASSGYYIPPPDTTVQVTQWIQ
jgi:hypothetical protein